MRKMVLTAFTVACMIAIAGCSSSAVSSGDAVQDPSEVSEETGGTAVSSEANGFVNMPNPWSEFLTLDEAVDFSGIELVIPDEYKGNELIYRAVANDMIEVNIPAGSIEGIDGDRVTFRATRLTDEDISGDYNTYSETYQVKTAGIFVTVRSNDVTKVNVATWSDEERSYCVLFREEAGSAPAFDFISSLVLANSVKY
ncbi:hypothetical protein SAMN02910456_00226 [Ruminococcaceae bacterium YRB3002]|nr:hypothetical protein SAMN02910456_00226 [Ruminococcaceae bacterium YRB3002]